MTGSALVLSMILAAQPTSAERAELQSQVDRLVKQLDATALADRESAERELSALGTRVLDLLPRENPTMRGEQRLRLARIRQVLEDALAASFTNTSKVTLEMADTPVSQVLEELARQTGNRTADYRPQFGQPSDDPRISVKFHETPYWEALDTVLDAAKLTVYGYAGGRELPLVGLMETDARRRQLATYDGPFRIEPVFAESRRDFRKSTGALLKLHLELSWEPRLMPVMITIPLAALQARDGQGNILKPSDEQPELEIPIQPETSVAEIELPFSLPEQGVRTIASLEGSASLVILGRQHVFEFTQLRERMKAEQRYGPVVVFVDDIRPFDEGIWRVFLRVRYDEASRALQSHLGWILRNEAAMVDAQGNRVVSQDYELASQGPNEVGVGYFFAVEGEIGSHTLTYTTPAAVIRRNVHFRLQNLELP